MPSLSPPEYRIHNLPNNITATDAYPFYIQDDSLPQDSLPPYPPPLHPALTAAYHREEANAQTIRNSRNVAVSRGKAASAESYDSAGNENCRNCRRIALTTGCVSAISAFVSTLVLLFLGLIFLHNFSNPTSPVRPVCVANQHNAITPVMCNEEQPDAALDTFMELLIPFTNNAPIKKFTVKTVKSAWIDDE
uniref:Uncharacterized protein n=1 Tax=Oncorhynchus tshawytscha TaxID=74940 RepID=A0AAZ3SLN3_ONCTS